jgi:hypothetical protein
VLDADQRDVNDLSGGGESRQPGHRGFYEAHGIADGAGGADKNASLAAILARKIGAASSFWLAQHLELAVAPSFAGDLVARFLDVLAALPPRVRLETCERLRLPVSMRPYGRVAGPVLRTLIEDEVLRPFFADGAARLWIELDMRDVALPAALGIVDEVSSMTILSLAQMVEPEEAFEFLFARFERDAFFAELLSRSALLVGEDRWVTPATSLLHRDAKNAARMLNTIATPRAVEELAGAVYAAGAVDDAFIAVWDESGVFPADVAVDAVVHVLMQPWATPEELGRLWSFAQQCRNNDTQIRLRLDDHDARAKLDAVVKRGPRARYDFRRRGGVLG